MRRSCGAPAFRSTIALCGIVFAGTVRGSDHAVAYALPLVLSIGLAAGLVNGIGIVVLGLSPIVMTLAMNGVAIWLRYRLRRKIKW